MQRLVAHHCTLALRRGTVGAEFVPQLNAAVFVLHVFQKKSKSGIATPRQEMELIRQRLKATEQIVKELLR
jgi:phage-related protein